MISICLPNWLHPFMVNIQSLLASYVIAKNTDLGLQGITDPSHFSVKVWLGQEPQLDLPCRRPGKD